MGDLKNILKDIDKQKKSGASGQDINHMIDLAQTNLKRNGEAAAIANEAAASVMDAMSNVVPTKGALLSALTTNNPVLAGALQMFREASATRKEAKKRTDAQHQAQLQMLEDQRVALAEEESGPLSDPNPVNDDLVRIQDEVKSIDMDILDINKKQLFVLEQLFQEWSGQEADFSKLAQQQLDEQRYHSMMMDQEAALNEENALKGTEKPNSMPVPIPSGVDPDELPDEKEFSGAGIFLMGLGAVMPVLKETGAKLMKFGKLLKVGPLALISAAVSFIDGMFDADEILGQAEVTITDRMFAGVARMVGSFGELIDFATGLFGYETEIGKTIEQGIVNVTNIPRQVLNSMFDYLSRAVTGIDASTKLADIPNMVWTNVQGMFIDAVNAIALSDTLAGINESMGAMKAKLKERVLSTADQAADAVSGFFISMWDGMIEHIANLASNIPFVGDDMKQKIEAFRSDGKMAKAELMQDTVSKFEMDKQKLQSKSSADLVNNTLVNNQNSQSTTVISSGVNTDNPREKVRNIPSVGLQ